MYNQNILSSYLVAMEFVSIINEHQHYTLLIAQKNGIIEMSLGGGGLQKDVRVAKTLIMLHICTVCLNHGEDLHAWLRPAKTLNRLC